MTGTNSTSASEFYSGLDGNDTFRGGTGTGPDGIDRFAGGDDIDTVSYSNRTDAITAVAEDPSVIGAPSTTDNDSINATVENLTGGSANDTLIGNDLANTLDGGGGDDSLRGTVERRWRGRVRRRCQRRRRRHRLVLAPRR